MRGWRAAGALALFGALVVAPAAPAFAQPGCTPAISADPQVKGIPWHEARYGAGRLAGIADGSGVTVAVIDSGVDATAPVLAGAVLRGRDLLDKSSNGTGQRDCVGHGTAVASIIAGTPGDGNPAGLAPGARILPYRVSEQEIVDGHPSGKAGKPDDIATAITDATNRGARVINLSLVLGADHDSVRAAVRYALAHDVVVVAAVGNGHQTDNPGGTDPVPYPAGYPGVLGVGGIDESGQRVPSSAVGPYVDLVAPGRAVVAAAPGHGVARFDGTSFAAPFVSATAALIRQYRPTLHADEVVARILATTDPAPGNRDSDEYGFGILDPYRAVTDQMPAPLAVAVPSSPPRLVADDARSPARRGTPIAIAIGALMFAGLVAFAASVTRAGNRRGWRPDRT